MARLFCLKNYQNQQEAEKRSQLSSRRKSREPQNDDAQKAKKKNAVEIWRCPLSTHKGSRALLFSMQYWYQHSRYTAPAKGAYNSQSGHGAILINKQFIGIISLLKFLPDLMEKLQ